MICFLPNDWTFSILRFVLWYTVVAEGWAIKLQQVTNLFSSRILLNTSFKLLPQILNFYLVLFVYDHERHLPVSCICPQL